MDTDVVPLLRVPLRVLGVEPSLEASSEAVFGVCPASICSSPGLRTSFEEGASGPAVGEVNSAGPRTAGIRGAQMERGRTATASPTPRFGVWDPCEPSLFPLPWLPPIDWNSKASATGAEATPAASGAPTPTLYLRAASCGKHGGARQAASKHGPRSRKVRGRSSRAGVCPERGRLLLVGTASANILLLTLAQIVRRNVSVARDCSAAGKRLPRQRREPLPTVGMARRWCAQNTSPDAHTRTFFSLSVSHFTHAHSAWLKMF